MATNTQWRRRKSLSSRCVFSFTATMALSKLTILIFLFNITSIKQGIRKFLKTHNKFWIILTVTTQCSNPFSTGNDTNLCYYYNSNSLSWIDAYNQCLTKTVDGILIQIFSIEQFNSLKNANIDQTSPFWLGANNFASCKFNEKTHSEIKNFN